MKDDKSILLATILTAVFCSYSTARVLGEDATTVKIEQDTRQHDKAAPAGAKQSVDHQNSSDAGRIKIRDKKRKTSGEVLRAKASAETAIAVPERHKGDKNSEEGVLDQNGFPKRIRFAMNSLIGSHAIYKITQKMDSLVSDANGRKAETSLNNQYDLTDEITDLDQDGIIYKVMSVSNVNAEIRLNGKKKKQNSNQVKDQLEGKTLGMKMKKNGDVVEQGDLATIVKSDMKGEGLLGLAKGWKAGVKILMNEEFRTITQGAGISFWSVLYFPEKEVAPGEKWSKNFSFMGLNSTYTFTLDGFKELEGIKYAAISMDYISAGSAQNMVASTVKGGDGGTTGETTITGHGTILFDYQKGIIHSIESSDKTLSVMTMTIMGRTITTKTDATGQWSQKLSEFRSGQEGMASPKK